MLLCCSLACTVIDGSSTTASVTSTGWWLEVHFSSVPVLQHKSFRSRQSDDTPNPCAWVSSLPLLFLLKPRKLSSPLPAQATLRFLKSSSNDALARGLIYKDLRGFLSKTLRTPKFGKLLRTNKSGCINPCVSTISRRFSLYIPINVKLCARARARLSAQSPPSFNMLISINRPAVVRLLGERR